MDTLSGETLQISGMNSYTVYDCVKLLGWTDLNWFLLITALVWTDLERQELLEELFGLDLKNGEIHKDGWERFTRQDVRCIWKCTMCFDAAMTWCLAYASAYPMRKIVAIFCS